jgi:outer membrane protein
MTRKTALLGCCAAALLWPAVASAETLQEALEAAYANNPTLAAQRANVRVADENVPLARVGGMPTVEENISYQENVLKGERQPSGFFSNPDRQLTAGFSFNAPITTFGAVGNSVKAAEARVDAGRMGLRMTESELFSAVVAAYMDVLRDEAAVQLNQRNAEVMRFAVRETNERLTAGTGGPTDVAQAEARLSLAESQVETAQSRLIASREQYIRLVGHPSGQLMPPPPLPQLPATAEEAVAVARQDNPELLAASSNARAAAADVEAADANRYPKFNAVGGINTYNYLGSLAPGTGPRNGDRGTTGFLGVQLKVPIVDGGRGAAELRQSQARHSVAVEQVADAERKAVAETRSAFANWRAATRVVTSAQRGVDANERVLAGMRAETTAGFRPLLDRLNAEQELLNAQVTMVTARRDAYVAGFALLAAMGRAEARDLQFDTSRLYDPAVNYERVKNRVLQFDREPEPPPVGTTTADTPPQDAAVQPANVPPVPSAP